MKKATLGAVAVAVAALAPAPAAFAQDAPTPTVCRGVIQDRIVDAVTVPFRSDCTLQRVIVLGDVEGAVSSRRLTLEHTTVLGNLDTRSTVGGVTLRASAVRGDVTVREPRGDVVFTSSAVGGATWVRSAAALHFGDGGASPAQPGNVFAGEVRVEGSTGDGTVHRNVIGGSLLLLANDGPFDVSRNLVRGRLSCEGNTVEPTGSLNLAVEKLGQCAGL